MSKEEYLEQLGRELENFNFKGSVEEEVLDTGICFHIINSGWCIERSHKILKTIISNLEVYCTDNCIDNSKFFIIID